MTTNQIPVVLEDGTVEYLPGDTVVTWCGMDGPQPLSAVERDWVTIVEDRLTLPDGRRCCIEGWRDEALRLRGVLRPVQAAAMRIDQSHAGGFYDGAFLERALFTAAMATLSAVPRRRGIYVASKSAHAPRWIALRSQGVPIVSTWIDEAGVDQTTDWPGLWDRCIAEAASAAALIKYVEPGDVPKGGLVELGAALHAGVPVLWVGPEYSTAPRHRLVRGCASFDEALALAIDLEKGSR